MSNNNPELRERIATAHRQFAPIRQRFDRPGTERGGCPRAGVTPIYVRRFGEHAATIFPNLTTVEASFDAEQLRAVTATLLLLKGWVTGQGQQISLRERIVKSYLAETRPYFVAALLRATEAMLDAFLSASPDHAPVVDAIFCVAGSEGFRDLIRLYDARALEHAATSAEHNFPDILAFTNMHERAVRGPDGQWQETRYEVWCPGYDLAKEFHQQCVGAAQSLVQEHRVQSAPGLQEEVTQLPPDLVAHLTRFARTRTLQVIQHAIST
jgi:hypothetical protein